MTDKTLEAVQAAVRGSLGDGIGSLTNILSASPHVIGDEEEIIAAIAQAAIDAIEKAGYEIRKRDDG